MKKLGGWLVAILLVVLVVVGIPFLMRSTSDASKAKDGPPTIKVVKGDLSVSVVETGPVEAVRSVEVRPQVSGRLEQLLVAEGDIVAAGQLIARVDPLQTQNQVDQNQAQLDGARSAVNRATLEINQRSVTAQASYQQALARLNQLRLEVEAQPKLSQAAIAGAEAAYRSAVEEKNRIVRSSQPNQRVQADSALTEAIASLTNAEKELFRVTDLEKQGYVATRSVENAQLQVSLAQARLRTAREAKILLESGLNAELAKVDEQINQARAELRRTRTNTVQDKIKVQDLKNAEAAVQSARASLGDPAIQREGRAQNQANVRQLESVLSDGRRLLRETEIRAPISGIVTRKLLEEGELASGLSGFSAGTPIVRIEDRTTLRVKLSVNEIDVFKLRKGMDVKISVDALPRDIYKGTIYRIAPTSTTEVTAGADAVIKYTVEVYFAGNTSKLRTGMTAKCSVVTSGKKGVLIVPIDYILREKDLRYLTLFKGKDKPAEKRLVVLGVVSGARVEVLEGVKEGDQLTKPDFNGPNRTGFFGGGDGE